MEFTEWINEQLNKRGWSQNELARRAGVTSAAMSRVMTGMRNPGVDLCRGIARALDVPEVIVMERAGLIGQPGSSEEISLRELYAILKELPVEEQRAIVAYALGRRDAVQSDTERGKLGPEPATS